MPTCGLILALDDDADDTDIMRFLFRRAGVTHPMQIYHRGEELITELTGLLRKSARAVLPMLCFLDVNMPSMSGHDVLRWIRKEPRFDPISVVMLSSSEDPADIRQAAEAGAQCYLAKHPQPEILKRIVEEAERVELRGSARRWFGLPANLMLRFGPMA
jgi:CheY-like chemotaxis protein